MTFRPIFVGPSCNSTIRRFKHFVLKVIGWIVLDRKVVIGMALRMYWVNIGLACLWAILECWRIVRCEVLGLGIFGEAITWPLVSGWDGWWVQRVR